MHRGGSHKAGHSLKPSPRFKYKGTGRVPAKAPKRTKRYHGRHGGIR